ncbi:MAG: EAL domain-containing protein [Lachnospiraceae bacterium]|nr:EAL domain-containing protein [Lachnospiraceae bacterium]
MIYNIHYDISAVVIFLFTLFYIFTKKGLKKRSNKIFLALVISGLISAVSDAVGSVANSYGNVYRVFVRDLWNYIFLGTHNLMPFLFTLYIVFLMGICHRMRRLHYALLCLPVASVLLALLLNPVFRWVFYYDTDNVYSHGRMMPLLYAAALFYMALVIVLAIRYRAALPKAKLYPLLLFMVCSTLPIIIQMLMPHLLIELFFQSLAMLGILFSIENEDELLSSITHVRNRFAFLSDVENAIQVKNTVKILTIKIPKSASYYNTTFGIRYMNHIFLEIAAWLESLGKDLHCYDCDGGHFTLVSYQRSEEDIRELAVKIKNRFETAWEHEDFRIVFPVQICITYLPEEIQTIEQMMVIVDSPFEGKNNESEIIDSNTFDTYQREILIEQLIKDALEKRTFQVWYQPIWDREQERIHSAEALVRLIDDKLGFIPPDEFIPIAEKNGTIIEIGAFVFEEVCSFFAKNDLRRLGIDFIEVNLSVVQCMNQKLVDTLHSIMEKYALNADMINLEITESAAASNQATLRQTVTELSNRGFSFALDDYGTGYSNFSYMMDMPFTIIKLDKSILWSAIDPATSQENTSAMVLLESTMHMMQKMNYRIVVEGVESQEQKSVLERLGCDYFQGYYFSKPIPPEPFLNYVREFNHSY